MLHLNVKTKTNGQAVLTENVIEEFAAPLSGRIIYPGHEAFDKGRQVWNGMIDKQPGLIARCASTADVIRSINFARTHNLLVAVRGGGHNVAGHAVCDGGMVIDLTPLNKVEVNPTTRLVKAGGGATIAELDQATQKHGLAVPMGVVSATGIAGLTLGGGIGWLRRKYGLSCDNLVSAEVVTAAGQRLTASPEENADLFWGLKGGGGNFGVVTNFNFLAHNLGPEVMFVFTLYHGSKIREALRFYRDYCATAPDEVSSFAICGDVPPEEDFPAEIHGEPSILFAACYAGSVAEGRRVMQPLREFDEPLADFSGPMAYADEVQTILDADYPDGMRYYWKSLFLDNLSDDVIEGIININEKRPGALSTVDIWQMGGAIARVDEQKSAFGGRQAPYLLGIEANWEESDNDQANVAWARQAVVKIEQFSGGAEYLNFPGFLEEEDKTMRTTFGQKYNRLAALKNKYDPDNMFHLNQNIKPDGG